MDNIDCKYFDLKNSELFLLIDKYCCVNEGLNLTVVPDGIKLLNFNWNSLLQNYFERSLEHLL